jgi:hypothetical protein
VEVAVTVTAGRVETTVVGVPSMVVATVVTTPAIVEVTVTGALVLAISGKDTSRSAFVL